MMQSGLSLAPAPTTHMAMVMGMDQPRNIGPEVFEAFAYAQPITSNIPSAFDPAWTVQYGIDE